MIEMQGPGVYLNPPNKPVYQESQTILPQAVVGVSQGIDYGAIAQSVAQLGTTLVELDLDNKRKKKSRLLEELEAKTRMGIDHASAYNDFDSVDAQIAEYKNQVKEIVGYDIDSDGGGQLSNSLLEQARQTSYGFELYGQKARRETADDVKSLAYNDSQLAWRESFAKSEVQWNEIQNRKWELQQIIKDAEAAPQKTIGDRVLISTVRKDLIELDELESKMNAAGAKSVSEAAEAERKGKLNKLVNLHREVTNGWELLGNLSKEIDELSAKKDRTEAEEAKISSLRIRANATAAQISDFEAILDTEKNNFATEHYGQTWSSDFAASTLTPEQYNSVLSADEKKSQTLSSLSFSPYNLMAARQREAITKINGEVDTQITESAAGIAAIDQRITEAQTPEEREYLLRARSAFITRLEQKVIGVIQGGVDPVTKNLVDTVSGLKFLNRRGLDYSVMPEALTAFAADSIESMTKPSSTVSRVFRPSVDKFNQFLSTRMDIPASKFAGSSSTKETRTQERLKESLFIWNELSKRNVVNASPDRVNTAFFDVIQASGINPYQDDNITLRPWSELAPEISSKNITLPPNGFTQTELYSKALVDTLRTDNPEEALQSTLTLFNSDTNTFAAGVYAATDRPSMTPQLADILVGGLENVNSRRTAMAIFMLTTPPSQIGNNIEQMMNATKGMTDDIKQASTQKLIGQLKTLATEYKGNGDPLEFVKKRIDQLPLLAEKQESVKIVLDTDNSALLIGKYYTSSDTKGEAVLQKEKVNAVVRELRAYVFPKLNINPAQEGNDFKQYITGNQPNTLMREITARAIDAYYDVLVDNKGVKDESFFSKVRDRVNAELQDYEVNTPEQGLTQRNTTKAESPLISAMTSGTGIPYNTAAKDADARELMLDANWDSNGLDMVTWNQFGSVKAVPSTDNPTALALALSVNRGTQLPPGDNKTEHLLAISAAVIGEDKSNRNMLIAQAAIRGLNAPATREQAIEQAKKNMVDIKRGLETGEYKFVVDTAQRSNLNDKQTAQMIVLKGKEGSTLAAMQPAPLRTSLVGSDVHKKYVSRITKENFGDWAVNQINAGTVDHTKVVDWLTVNNKSSITLSETLQWFETPIVDIPASIPNEDYTYELVDHMGKKQWFVTKDGGERLPIRSSFSVDELEPVDTVKYVYTGAEGRISRRTGVTTVAGKPLVTFEWKGMGTKWMLDSSRYDTTQPTFTEPTTKQEREWETFIRTNIQGSIETQRLLNMVVEALDNSPKTLKDMGTEPTSGDFNAALAAKPFVKRDGIAAKYLTTIAGKPVVISKEGTKVGLEMPKVKEREVTTGLVDIKDIYVYDENQSEKLTYVRPTNSDTWSLLEGPAVGNTNIPKTGSEAERFYLYAVEFYRRVMLTGDREQQLKASRLLERSTATLGEAKRLKNEPDKLRAFEKYVKTEIDQLFK